MEDIKVMTAEEIAKKIFPDDAESGFQFDSFNNTTKNFIKKAMIEFAKLHVNAALKEALESIPCLGSSSDIPTYEEVEEAVLNCYPENLIQ